MPVTACPPLNVDSLKSLGILVSTQQNRAACDRGKSWPPNNRRKTKTQELHVSSKVLVIGKGKPFLISQVQASQWVHEAKAIWQKPGRRIRYMAGKCSRPEVRGLSCFVGEAVTAALMNPDKRMRDVVRVFLRNQFLKREIAAPSA